MNIAVILIGGNGTRMSSSLPKQFIKVNEKEIFIHTVEKFVFHPLIDRCLLVINEMFKDDYIKILESHNLLNKVELCFGGATRQESSFNALKHLKNSNALDEDIILFHDGARPMLTKEIITNNIEKCLDDNAVISTVIPMVDTLVNKENELIDRNSVYVVQTPQTFKLKDAYEVHIKANENNITNSGDDVLLAKHFNKKISYVDGSRMNIKITTKDDLELLNLFLRK